MRIAYDAMADALSLVWVEAETEISREIMPGVVVSFDGAGRAVALAILQASAQLGPDGLGQIMIDLSHQKEGTRQD